MPKRKRNYKQEYRRRLARGLAKGLSKSQARGHRRPAEGGATQSRAKKELEDRKLQLGLRFLRKTKSFTKAAQEAHISPERLRTFAAEKNIIEKRGRRWVVRQDLPRRVLIFSNGHERQIIVGDFKAASLVGKYMSAVSAFTHTNNISFLRPFTKKTVTDQDGKAYPLEVRPNVLKRPLQTGSSSFQQVYRILI